MKASVVIPCHNSDPVRLGRVLTALAGQTLPASDFETVVVDNASRSFPSSEVIESAGLSNLRIVREPEIGLTHARQRGLAETRGEIVLFVDDDNVLVPTYLETAVTIMARHDELGAAGGRSLGEFESPPSDWNREFFALLALRDLGPVAEISTGLRIPGSNLNHLPRCAPIGAGMVLRREAATAWAEGVGQGAAGLILDRQGGELSSGGDNDIIFAVMAVGWQVGYFPELTLTHLIPSVRLQPGYLARLNRAIQKSWMRVLRRHSANPWPMIPAWTVPPRKLKAWFAFRAWQGPAEFIRWQGACGHFDGRICS